MKREGAWLPPREAGRLFRTIVVVGGSLALGCGGKTDVPDGDGDTDDSGSGGAVSGSGGAASGSGGAVSGSGGAASGSGGAASGSGGAVSGGGGSIGGDGSGGRSTDCPPEQWDCSDADLESYYGGDEFICSYVLPDDCFCDLGRPLDVDDCPSGTARTCLAAGADAQGEALDEVTPFACKCLPFDPETQYCNAACDEHGDVPTGPSHCVEEPTPYINILCGCELPILR